MELTKEYAKAYVEVLEVIKYLTEDEYNKIPKEKIELYEKYKDTTYEFVYNPTEILNNQISFEAKNVLANLFLKYISTTEARNEVFNEERKKWYEEESKKTYDNLNPVFGEKKIIAPINDLDSSKEDGNGMIVVEEKSCGFVKKIISKIKKIFKI